MKAISSKENRTKKTYFDAGTIQNSIGKITGLQALRLSGGSVDGNGVLCSVTFTVVGTGECRLTLENFEAGTATGSSVPSIPPELRIVVEGDEPEIPAWDVNMDGQTDVNDILLVTTAIVLEQTPADNPRADVNGDGLIDKEDVEIINPTSWRAKTHRQHPKMLSYLRGLHMTLLPRH